MSDSRQDRAGTVLVDQPSIKPTRKVLLGAVAAVLAAGLNALLVWLIGSHEAFAWLDDPNVRSTVPIFAGFGAAWLFRDRTPAAPPTNVTPLRH